MAPGLYHLDHDINVDGVINSGDQAQMAARVGYPACAVADPQASPGIAGARIYRCVLKPPSTDITWPLR